MVSFPKYNSFLPLVVIYQTKIPFQILIWVGETFVLQEQQQLLLLFLALLGIRFQCVVVLSAYKQEGTQIDIIKTYYNQVKNNNQRGQAFLTFINLTKQKKKEEYNKEQHEIDKKKQKKNQSKTKSFQNNEIKYKLYIILSTLNIKYFFFIKILKNGINVSLLKPSAQTMKLRSKINKQNIHKQGKVPKSLMKTEEAAALGPILLGVLLFVVVGSALFQILSVLSNSNEV